MRSRAPSPSVSSVVSTKTTSSMAFANANCGAVTPFSSFSHGGGCSCAAAAGVTMAANATTVASARRRDDIEPLPWLMPHTVALPSCGCSGSSRDRSRRPAGALMLRTSFSERRSGRCHAGTGKRPGRSSECGAPSPRTSRPRWSTRSCAWPATGSGGPSTPASARSCWRACSGVAPSRHPDQRAHAPDRGLIDASPHSRIRRGAHGRARAKHARARPSERARRREAVQRAGPLNRPASPARDARRRRRHAVDLVGPARARRQHPRRGRDRRLAGE